MIELKENGTQYYSFNNFEPYKDLVINFTTTRKDGNMGKVDLVSAEALINIESLLTDLQISLSSCVFADQEHGNNVGVVNDISSINLSEQKLRLFPNVDALITNTKNVCTIIKTADCTPVTFYDPRHIAVGVAHAGRKGTLLNISGNALLMMQKNFGTDPEDVVVGLGPSIGPEDYLIMEDVYRPFIEAGYEKFLQYVSPNQWLLDLWSVNKFQLLEAGVKEQNIEVSAVSTYSSDMFFSARKRDPVGHFITGVMLK